MVLQVPINKVRAGMQTARPVYHNCLVLLKENTTLTPDTLRRLKQWGIPVLSVRL